MINKIGGLKFINKIFSSFLNLKGILMFAVEKRLHKKNLLICEHCFRKMKVNIAYIGYYLSNPVPRDFFIGHKGCVEKELEAITKIRTNDLSVVIEELDKFYNNQFVNINKTFESEMLKDPIWESEFKSTVKRLIRIKKAIHI
jgi:hypothetical protein